MRQLHIAGLVLSPVLDIFATSEDRPEAQAWAGYILRTLAPYFTALGELGHRAPKQSLTDSSLLHGRLALQQAAAALLQGLWNNVLGMQQVDTWH